MDYYDEDIKNDVEADDGDIEDDVEAKGGDIEDDAKAKGGDVEDDAEAEGEDYDESPISDLRIGVVLLMPVQNQALDMTSMVEIFLS